MSTQAQRIALSDMDCPLVDARTLIETYDVLLLDAFGVLVHSSAALPGAAEFIRSIKAAGKSFFIVTNDASKLPETSATTLRGYGLDVQTEQIISSGMLLEPFFASTGLEGARCMVLGPEDSFESVRRAGGIAIAPSEDAEFDALVLCDDAGYPFLETMDLILSCLFRAFDSGQEPRLIVPNPDVIYPRGERCYGFTSGGAALMLEAALGQRYPLLKPSFARLGKPFGPMFREVQRRVGAKKMIMIGDQIETDIVGARALDIDAALVEGGIARWDLVLVDPARAPNYRLKPLASEWT